MVLCVAWFGDFLFLPFNHLDPVCPNKNRRSVRLLEGDKIGQLVRNTFNGTGVSKTNELQIRDFVAGREVGGDKFRLAEEFLDFDLFNWRDSVSNVADDLEKNRQRHDADADRGNRSHPHAENVHALSLRTSTVCGPTRAPGARVRVRSTVLFADCRSSYSSVVTFQNFIWTPFTVSVYEFIGGVPGMLP